MSGLDWSEIEAEFVVTATACPHFANRVLGLFAQQLLLPSSFQYHLTGDLLSMRITHPALARHRAEVIAAKIEAMVGTVAVALDGQTIDAAGSPPG